MKNEKIWQLRNLRDRIIGTTPINNLFVVLHSTAQGQEYCVIKLIFQSESPLGYTTSRFQSINNGDIIEVITESKHLQTLQYESEFDYNGGYRMSYFTPLKDALPYLQIPERGYINSSMIKQFSDKYNKTYGFSQPNITANAYSKKALD